MGDYRQDPRDLTEPDPTYRQQKSSENTPNTPAETPGSSSAGHSGAETPSGRDASSKNDTPIDAKTYWRQQLGQDEPEDPGQQEYWNGFTEHGYGTSNDPDYGQIPEEYRVNSMSRAALICGIISLVCIVFPGLTPLGSMIFGSLGILFALLSRREKLNRQAGMALGLSAAGLGVTVVLFAVSFIFIIANGLWDDVVSISENVDPSDPNAMAEAQQELMDEIMEKYGVYLDDSSGS